MLVKLLKLKDGMKHARILLIFAMAISSCAMKDHFCKKLYASVIINLEMCTSADISISYTGVCVQKCAQERICLSISHASV